MTEHEKYQEHIRHTHDVFCKTVIRHAVHGSLLRKILIYGTEWIVLFFYHRWNRKSFSYTTSNDGRIERLGRDMDGQATQPGGGFR